MQLRNLAGRGSERPVLDRQALMIILRNLMRNVIQHASPGNCEVRRSATGLEISDNGPGIAPEILPRIFDRYFSGRLVDVSTAAERELAGVKTSSSAKTGITDAAAISAEEQARRAGHGLGLAIAEQTAVQQHWRLAVRSTLGKGTTFTLDFE